MKKIFIYVFLLLATLCARISVNAQVVEICAGNGTDSVTLYLDNYRYGLVQWQCSADGYEWLDVEGENDTTYRFLPEKDGYYRAMVFYTDCPYDSSRVSHVVLAPRADAGIDKVVNVGSVTQMFANEMLGTRSMWEVLEGDNAVIDDEEDPYTLFSGTDTLYRLQWTLANVCGVSHDTVEIRYVEPEFYDAIVVVDTTDQMFGDSLERFLGLYRIVFSDPAPVVTDSTILVGIPYGGFLRKVLYAEHHGDTVVMYTRQATLDELFVSGAFEFNSIPTGAHGGRGGLYTRMDHQPTRAELQEMQNQRDRRIRIYEYETQARSSGDEIIEADAPVSFITSRPSINFDSNIEFSDFNVDVVPYLGLGLMDVGGEPRCYFKVKLNVPISFKMKLKSSFSIGENASHQMVDWWGGFSLDAKKKEIVYLSKRVLILVGYVPLELRVSYALQARLSGSATLNAEKTFNCTGNISFEREIGLGNESEVNRHPITGNFTIEPLSGIDASVSVDASFDFNHDIKFMLYETLGPYVNFSTPMVKYNLCQPLVQTEGNLERQWTQSFSVGVPLSIGLYFKIFSKSLWDIHLNFKNTIVESLSPYKLTRYGESDYHHFQLNDVVPVKVQLWKKTLRSVEPFSHGRVEFSTNNGTLRHHVIVSDPDGGWEGFIYNAEPVDVIADENGIATAYWKPNDPNANFIQVKATDCSGSDIEGSPMNIVVDNCGDSDLHLDIVDGTLRPSGGVGGYLYATNISTSPSFSWSPIMPVTLIPGNTYFVKSGTCVASAVCPVRECRLNVSHSLRDNILAISAQNGTGPYSFYLNENFWSHSMLPQVVIPLQNNGSYTVKVVDAKGCVARDSNIVYLGSKTAPLVFTNGAYNNQNNVYDDVQGIILSDGNCNITERGIYWSTSASMASATKIMSSSNSDNFVCHIPNVPQGQVLYACAYAVNEKGSGYGDTIALQQTDSPTPDQPTGNGNPCPGIPTVTDHDGNVYNTVQIGDQCWMKENLKTTKYADGTSIPQGTTTSNTDPYWYYPNDNSANKATYGLLYNWPAVMHGSSSSSSNPSGVQGICPTGWHVPSDAEWTQLTTYVKGHNEYVCPGCSGTDDEWTTFCIAKALASTTGWNSDGGTCCVGNTPSTNNATGFSAVPAGAYSGRYNYFGIYAYFWSATQYNSFYAYFRRLDYNSANVYRYENGKYLGFSVRCIRDENTTSEVLPNSCPGTPTVTDHDGNVYNTVQIGDQCWMKENLKTTKYADGTSIPQGTTTSYADPYWYYPNDNSANKATYGLLYNWKAVMRNASSSSSSPSGVQGICPQGWHVPSDAEWTQLTDYVSSQSEYQCGGSSENIAKALASTTGWNSSTYNCEVGNTPGENNATGFSAVPAGNYNDSYNLFGDDAYFWSATQGIGNGAFNRTLYHYNAFVDRYNYGKYYGLSVRCLRDSMIGSDVIIDAHSCPGTPTVTDHEGNVYNTVQIGSQCWTKENMRCTTSPSTGTTILEYPAGSYSYTGKKAYYPNLNASNVATYGLLYNWNAAVDTFNTAYGETSTNTEYSNAPSVTFGGNRRGICPQGWHVPSLDEWRQLRAYVSSQSQYVCGSDNTYIAKALASTTGWNSSTYTCVVGNTPSTNNATGFSAVPAGCYDGSYLSFGFSAYFWSATQSNIWSATQSNSDGAFYRGLIYGSATVSSYYYYSKYYGFSVRCVRD